MHGFSSVSIFQGKANIKCQTYELSLVDCLAKDREILINVAVCVPHNQKELLDLIELSVFHELAQVSRHESILHNNHDLLFDNKPSGEGTFTYLVFRWTVVEANDDVFWEL